MIDEEDQQNTLIFINRIHKKKHLKTQNNFNYQHKQRFIPKWQQSTFYHDVKKKIHQKLKTQSSLQQGGIYNLLKKNKNGKQTPKSKLTISTLQIALDPMCKKMMQDTFQIERKIFHKVDSSINVLKMKPSKMIRNMSAKISRKNSEVFKSSRSLQKKQQNQTCRKNSRPDLLKLTGRQNNGKKQTQQQKPDSQRRQAQIIQEQNNNLQENRTGQSLKQKMKYKMRYSMGKNMRKQIIQSGQSTRFQRPIDLKRIKQNAQFLQNKEVSSKIKQQDYMIRLKNSKSQLLQKKQTSPLKMQTFDTKPLMFYFKARHNIKASNRQIGIKKIRVRSMKGFIGIPTGNVH